MVGDVLLSVRQSRQRAGGPLLASALTAACTCWAGDVRADEPQRPTAARDPSATPATGTGTTLFVVGAALTAGWYGGAVGVSYLWPSADGAEPLRIPVAGPYMALARTGCGDRESSCGTFTMVFRAILTGITAVGQTGGVLAMAEALVLPTTSAESTKPAAAVEQHAARVPVVVTPSLVGSDGVGVGVSGSF